MVRWPTRTPRLAGSVHRSPLALSCQRHVGEAGRENAYIHHGRDRLYRRGGGGAAPCRRPPDLRPRADPGESPGARERGVSPCFERYSPAIHSNVGRIRASGVPTSHRPGSATREQRYCAGQGEKGASHGFLPMTSNASREKLERDCQQPADGTQADGGPQFTPS